MFEYFFQIIKKMKQPLMVKKNKKKKKKPEQCSTPNTPNSFTFVN